MRKRIALVAVVAAAAVAYTAYKKAKMQKVAQHDKDNPLIVKPLNGEPVVVDAPNVLPQAEEPSETETLEEGPVESVDTDSFEAETVPPITQNLSSEVVESNDPDPFGLDTFIHETPQIEPEEIVSQVEVEEIEVPVEPEPIIEPVEPEEVIIPEETVEQLVTEPLKPEIPEPSTLTNTLLESYRIQCKVMMDGYPSNKKIDLIHHIEFKDPANRNKFVDSLQIEYHEIEDSPEGLSATIRQTIPTDARVAYAEIVKLAEASEAFHGLYQGWVLVDCR